MSQLASWVQEPILALRRQLAVVSGADAEAGQCWLQQAKLCRVSGHFEAATTASLEALARQVPGAGLERAKLLWDMDKPHRAIISLQEVQCFLTNALKFCLGVFFAKRQRGYEN
jgi:serine/threonine-protein kinase ATR